jgi:hypothetical protein
MSSSPVCPQRQSSISDLSILIALRCDELWQNCRLAYIRQLAAFPFE